MRSVKRDPKHEELVRRLTEAAHPTTGKTVFSTIRDLMCFAAALGFENGARIPLPEKALDLESRPFQNNDFTMDLIYLVALLGSKDPEILREENEDNALRIFEEYANGGLGVLDVWMKEKPDDIYGDRAILAALTKYGFLKAPASVEKANASVTF